jgi:hypothetical protein
MTPLVYYINKKFQETPSYVYYGLEQKGLARAIFTLKIFKIFTLVGIAILYFGEILAYSVN